MTIEEVMKVLELILLAISGVGVPVLIALRQAANRRLDHLDRCIDALKLTFAGEVVTRADLERNRTELQTSFNQAFVQLRADMTGQFTSINQRVFRIEDNFFAGSGRYDEHRTS